MRKPIVLVILLLAALSTSAAVAQIVTVTSSNYPNGDGYIFSYKFTSNTYNFMIEEFMVITPLDVDYLYGIDNGDWDCEVYDSGFGYSAISWVVDSPEFGLFGDDVTLRFGTTVPVTITNSFGWTEYGSNWAFQTYLRPGGDDLFAGIGYVGVPGSVIPEPATLTAISAALGTLMLRGRKSYKK